MLKLACELAIHRVSGLEPTMGQTNIVIMISILFLVAGGTAILYMHEQKRSLDSEIGKRFPYEAILNGRTLIMEDGRAMHFRTQQNADQYARDYAKP